MKQKRMILAAAALAAAAVLLLVLYFMTRPATQEGSKSFTVQVVHADGTSREFHYTSDEEYVGSVLIEAGLIDGKEGAWGMYIETVDGERAVYETDGAYWALYVGEEYATQSIELTPLEDGGTYSLVYTLG